MNQSTPWTADELRWLSDDATVPVLFDDPLDAPRPWAGLVVMGVCYLVGYITGRVSA